MKSDKIKIDRTVIKKNVQNFGLISAALALIVILYKKLPTAYNNFILKNSELQNISIRRLSGEEISLPNPQHNKIVIFWATWCESCHTEMKKLNEMLFRGELKAGDLIAISLDKNLEDVIKFIEQQNYQFLIAHDYDSSLSRKFNIGVTPTVFFINKNSNIDWVSTGVNSELEKKAKDFLKN